MKRKEVESVLVETIGKTVERIKVIGHPDADFISIIFTDGTEYAIADERLDVYRICTGR